MATTTCTPALPSTDFLQAKYESHRNKKMELDIGEYQYLRMCAFFEFSRKMMESCEPIQKQINEALSGGDWEKAAALEQERAGIAAQLFWERVRSEDIIRWLELDSLLRREGRSYPDVFERLSMPEGVNI
ncbi:hypothetical protein [Nostoc sp. FACHB-110]|uniref:hypothetical protein n=1 Tax=Nostoc sp. FACHB-110 TaxID=2692834 RepID=UPI00168634A4|nr:hypothetical protein [Nostoc sp. FACHB-110]MBD2437384.1 hypothetical protein [Nostoc sp. FACHB-110]